MPALTQGLEHLEIEEVRAQPEVADERPGQRGERRGNGVRRLEMSPLDAVAERDDGPVELRGQQAPVVLGHREDDVGLPDGAAVVALRPRRNARELKRMVIEIVA